MAKREPAERLMTLEEYAALPEADDYRDELSRGRLVREPRVWLIDPDDRTAVVYLTPGDVRVLRDGEELDGGDVVPGFRCSLADLFD